MQPLNDSNDISLEQAKMLKQHAPDRYMLINETNGVKTESTLLRLEDYKSWKIRSN